MKLALRQSACQQHEFQPQAAAECGDELHHSVGHDPGRYEGTGKRRWCGSAVAAGRSSFHCCKASIHSKARLAHRFPDGRGRRNARASLIAGFCSVCCNLSRQRTSRRKRAITGTRGDKLTPPRSGASNRYHRRLVRASKVLSGKGLSLIRAWHRGWSASDPSRG